MTKNHLMCGLALVALATMATACSDDDIATDDSGKSVSNGGYDGPGAYISVDFSLPTGSFYSRTATPEGGASTLPTEQGLSSENNVKNVAIILCGPDDTYVTHKVATNGVDDDVISYDQASSSSSRNVYRSWVKFSKTQIDKFYDNNTGQLLNDYGNGIRVYIVCNPTQSLTDLLKSTTGGTDWIHAYGEVSETKTTSSINWTLKGDIPWQTDQFVMSNYQPVLRALPPYLSMWDGCQTISTPFRLSDNNNLTYEGQNISVDNSVNSLLVTTNNQATQNGGFIQVQRAAARFDYKDGCTIENKQSLYHVIYMDQAGDAADQTTNGSTPYIDIELVKMSMVNMGRHYYFFKHISKDGMLNSDSGAVIGGDEYGGSNFNYVVDWDWEWKTTAYADWTTVDLGSNANSIVNPNSIDYHFNFPMFSDGSGNIPNAGARSNAWYTSKISTVLNNTEDNEAYTTAGYHIWRYAVENCIPGPEETQVNGLSTGIVFKGKMKSAFSNENGLFASHLAHFEDSLHAAIDGKKLPIYAEGTVVGEKKVTYSDQPILYLLNGMLYYKWEACQAAALISAIGDVNGTLPTYSTDSQTKYYKLDDNGNEVEAGSDAAGIVRIKGGTWTYTGSMARNNPDYLAVFGNQGFGKFMLSMKVDGVVKEGYITDTQNSSVDQQSANYNAMRWNGVDPLTGTTTGEYRQDSDIEKAFKKAATKAGITIYQPSYDSDFANGTDYNAGWGYYCYYYYWNRHNDNGKPGTMGPMEFAVVRNNVYKLRVDKISRLGHPRLIENDPNPPTPGTPDEVDDVYLSVQCEVLPWVVRENGIVF